MTNRAAGFCFAPGGVKLPFGIRTGKRAPRWKRVNPALRTTRGRQNARILWGRSTSSNVTKVIWTLEELKLLYERIDVGGLFGKTETAEIAR